MKKLYVIATAAFVTVSLNVNAEEGSAIYAKECAKCHGADGKGETTIGKKLKLKDLSAAKLTDAQIVKAVKEGVKEGDKMRMKAYSDMSDADAQAVAKYVGTLKK